VSSPHLSHGPRPTGRQKARVCLESNDTLPCSENSKENKSMLKRHRRLMNSCSLANPVQCLLPPHYAFVVSRSQVQSCELQPTPATAYVVCSKCSNTQVLLPQPKKRPATHTCQLIRKQVYMRSSLWSPENTADFTVVFELIEV
jgi:hypothetical protein